MESAALLDIQCPEMPLKPRGEIPVKVNLSKVHLEMAAFFRSQLLTLPLKFTGQRYNDDFLRQ